MTILANAHRKKGRSFKLTDFLPRDLARSVRASTGIRLTKGNLKMLKPWFEKQK